MKYFKFLDTDFYQLAMSFVYLYNDTNKEKSGFEGFVRNIKKAVNPVDDFYIFDGEDEIHQYIEDIKKEFEDPKLLETFIQIVEPKITSKNKEQIINKVKENWKKIDFNFIYNVVKNNTKVFPQVPVFQFYGDKMIGTIIETYITNIYNGRTGLKTMNYLIDKGVNFKLNVNEFNYISGIVNEKKEYLDMYKENLQSIAKEFRDSTNIILLEAGFRRAPSKAAADIASIIAMENNWNGTSNVGVGMKDLVSFDKINGTMDYSFIMNFETEEEAFSKWNEVFPHSTFLIDTYNVKNCFTKIKDYDFKEVRIDSGPIEDYVIKFKEHYPTKGIFVSGNMIPQKLQELTKLNITKAMAGTKYVYCNEIIEKVNCGFVYKLVEYEKNGKKFS